MVGEESISTRLTTAETVGNEKGVRSLGSITAFFQRLENKGLQSLGKGDAPGGNIIGCNKTSQIVQDISVSSASDGEETCVEPRSCGIPGNNCSQKNVEIPGKKTQQKRSRPKWSLTCKMSTSSKWLSDSNSDFEDNFYSSSARKNKQVHKSRKKKRICAEGCKGSPDFQGEPKTKATGLPNVDEKQMCKSESPRMAKDTCETRYKHCTEQNTMSVVSSSSGDEKLVKRTSAFDILMNYQKSCRTEEPRTENKLTESPCTLSKSSVCKPRISHSSISVEDEETLSNPTILNTNDHCLGNAVLSFSLRASGSSKIKADKSETSAFDFLMRKRETVKLDLSVESLTDSDMDSKNQPKLQRKSKKSQSRTREVTDIALCSESGDRKQDDNGEQKPTNDTKFKAVKGIRQKTRESDPSASMDSSFDKAEEESSKISESKTRRSLKKSRQNRADHQTEVGDVCGSEGKANQDGKVSKRARSKKSRTSTYHSDMESNFSKTGLDQRPDGKDFEPTSKGTKRKSAQLTKGCENQTKTKEDKTTKCWIKGRESLEIVVLSDRGLKEAHIVQDGTNKGTDKINETLQATVVSPSSEKEDNSQRTVGNDRFHDFKSKKEPTDSKEPKNLAPIFQKKNPITQEQNESRTPEVSSLSGKSSTGTVEHVLDHKAELSQKKTRSNVDNEAAMNAFKALFKGARLERTLSSSAPVIALPAPWPATSHVVQKKDSESVDDTFWNLPWPSEKWFKVHATRGCSELYDGSKVPLIPACLFVNTTGRSIEGNAKNLMFTQHSRRHKEVALENFSEAVIKSILLEMALVYPGVPLRKLFKRYKVKQESYIIVDALEDSKNISEKNTLAASLLNNKLEEGDEKTVAQKKGRRKKTMSVDDSVDQGKKSTGNKELSVSMSYSTNSQDIGLSSRPSRRKRSREEEDEPCEPQQTNKGRRLLTRLQKKDNTWRVSSSGEFSNADAVPSRKKRRRTTNHVVEERTATATATEGKTAETERTPEMLPVPTIEERCHRNEVKETLWTDLYRPLCSTEVMANASSVSKLRSWLEEWKIKRERTLRKELQQQKRLLAKQKNSSSSNGRSSSQTVEWWDADGDSDFQMSDASYDSDTEGGRLSTSMFISGPKGAGKTAMVYACAEELGYKVFEVNCASKRSGKQILSQLEEATQSHLVVSHKPVAANNSSLPQTSLAGLINKPSETSLTGSSLQSSLQPKEQTSADKTKKNKKEKKVKEGEKKVKEKTNGSCKNSGKPILKQPLQTVGKEDSQSASNLSQKAASLILFEEVDIIFEEDKSFWMAVNSFMQNAKCPIILISTDPLVSCEGRYDHISLKAPSVNLLSAHLQLVALVNNLFINPEELKAMVTVNGCDIRKSLMSLQFWAESGGGVMMQYKRPSTVEAEGNTAASVSQDSSRTASSQETDTNFTPPNAASSLGNDRALLKPDSSSSAGVVGNEGVFLSGILNDTGEESMFLSLIDWQSIKSRGGRNRLRVSRRGFPSHEVSNSDSDFSEPRKKMLVCADGSADSIFEITDTNDSQSAASSDKKAADIHQLPGMQGLLLESVHGMLNCVTDPTASSLSTLQIGKPHGHPVKASFTEKLHITHFCQNLGVDVVYSNLSHLLPLFAQKSRMGQAHCKLPKPAEIAGDKIPKDCKEDCKDVNMFGDTSLFDDGTERSGNKKRQRSVLGLIEPATKTWSSSQTSTDTGFSETEQTEGRGEVTFEVDAEAGSLSKTEGTHADKTSCGETKWNGKALEVFEQFAENMSCVDAFYPDFPKCNTISNSSESTWWAASLKPGLTDEHVTVQDTADWSAQDTRAAIRGAMEVASLDSCFVKVKSLAVALGEMKKSSSNEGDENVDSCNTVEANALYDFGLMSESLPNSEPKSVLCWNFHSQIQQRNQGSMSISSASEPGASLITFKRKCESISASSSRFTTTAIPANGSARGAVTMSVASPARHDKLTFYPRAHHLMSLILVWYRRDLNDKMAQHKVNLDSGVVNGALASRRKLHSSLSSCFPALYHCSHRCLVTDYLPTLRLLCHSERVREAANIKRRFLHYLDSNSFPLSRATMDALADSYMAS